MAKWGTNSWEIEETTSHKAGEFCSLWYRLRKGMKKRSYYHTGYSFLVTHPGTNPAKQDLTLLSGRDVFLSLWYSESIRNCFLISKIRKGNKERKNHYTTRTEPHVVRSTKLSLVLWDSYLDEWPTTNTTCCNNFFFSFPFEGDIKDCRTPQPCVMSLVSQLFVPHFAMSAFACIFTISYNRTNKQPDPSFEFFSILLTFGCLKQ